MILAFAMLLEAESLLPPQDWNTLPKAEFRQSWRINPSAISDVIYLAQTGRCNPLWIRSDELGFRIPIVMYVAPDGSIRQLGVISIGCKSIENYTASLAWKKFRPKPFVGSEPLWYQTSIQFSWKP